jgi:hypothetical protein
MSGCHASSPQNAWRPRGAPTTHEGPGGESSGDPALGGYRLGLRASNNCLTYGPTVKLVESLSYRARAVMAKAGHAKMATTQALPASADLETPSEAEGQADAL